MRPAYLFAETASKFNSKIELIKDNLRIDGKSVLSILTLGAAQGTEVLIEATGEDAESAIGILQDLLSSGFPTGQAPPLSSTSPTPATDSPPHLDSP